MDTAQTLEKRCSKCKVVYPATTDSFHKDGRHKDGFQHWCKKCCRQYNQDHKENARIWRTERQQQHPLYFYEPFIKTKYGISITEHNRLFEQQNGCCAICGRHQIEFKKRLCIDHNHTTGQIRGLLCSDCNALLGFAHDNMIILKAAMCYLSQSDNIPK